MGGVWETVHTVNDFYDGPRRGVADFGGVPHAYASDWDSAADDWSSIFRLKPVEPSLLDAVLEDWAIWLRWDAARRAGTLGPDDLHPALAVDRARHEALKPRVEEALHVDDATAIRAVPEFRYGGPASEGEVRWTPARGAD